MTPLERVTARVTRVGNPDDSGTPRPLLTVEEFFEGNDVVGSIGCNLPDEPTPEQFYSVLNRIAQRPDVKDIRVQVTAFDMPEWPFSDTVYIVTTASTEDVAGWFPEELAPDDVFEGFPEGLVHEEYQVPLGHRLVGCWWD